MKQNVLCPVCERHVFEWENDFDICPFCGWENDGVQGGDHDYWGGANDLTVNQSKLFFSLSQDIKKKDKLLSLKKTHRDIQLKIHRKYDGINHLVYGRKVRDEFYDEHLRYISEINKLVSEG